VRRRLILAFDLWSTDRAGGVGSCPQLLCVYYLAMTRSVHEKALYSYFLAGFLISDPLEMGTNISDINLFRNLRIRVRTFSINDSSTMYDILWFGRMETHLDLRTKRQYSDKARGCRVQNVRVQSIIFFYLSVNRFLQGIGVAKKVYDPDIWRLVAMLGSFTPKELIAGPPRCDVTFSPIIMGVLYISPIRNDPRPNKDCMGKINQVSASEAILKAASTASCLTLIVSSRCRPLVQCRFPVQCRPLVQ